MSESNGLDRLQRAVQAEPHNGELRYLLGAELAQAGRYDEALVQLSRALEIQPALHTARLQLGLLHLTLVQPERSLSVWTPLEALDDGAPLKWFKRGLEALIRDDFAACIRHLEHGIALNSANPALNGDMTLIINKAREALHAQGAAARDEVRTDFSLYDQSSN